MLDSLHKKVGVIIDNVRFTRVYLIAKDELSINVVEGETMFLNVAIAPNNHANPRE